MDEIRLNGLRVVGTHGVLPEEQSRPQPFAVDAVLSVDLTRAAKSDALEDTIDYGEVTDLIAGVVSTEHFALLERLAGRIAEAVLGLDERIIAIDVAVTKLRPPVASDLATASVRITRSR